MLLAYHHHTPMLLLPLVYLATLFVTGYCGAFLGDKAGMPKWAGALIGILFHLPGLIFLLVLDLLFGSRSDPPTPGVA